MQNKISSLISSTIPTYLRESSPLLISFLETYYKYAQQRTKAIGVIQNFSKDSDIDETLDSYLYKFYAIYGKDLPSQVAMDKRNLIKLLNSVYEAKGTDKALKLIFRALFNEEISINLPSKNILRASSGIWERYNFITLSTISGTLPKVPFDITYSNTYGNFSLNIDKIESVDLNNNRLYFHPNVKVFFTSDELIKVNGISNNASLYSGRLVKSPSKIEIQKGGKSWQLGQVIIIPGTTKSTFAQVTSVSPIGAVTGVEILEHGYSHSQNQSIIISPYPNKPLSSSIDVTSTLISIDPNIFHHEISISESTDGVFESISGVTLGNSPRSYFLEDYVVDNYSGYSSLEFSSLQLATKKSNVDSELTIEEYALSKATFLFIFSDVVSTKGYYKDDSGQLSNREISLQDNYFFQAFSYVIETSKDIRDYSSVLNITHPAGTKRFSSLKKEISLNLSCGIDRVIDIIY